MKKKVLCLVFAVVSLMLVSAIYAEDDGLQSVMKNKPKPIATPIQVEQYETGWIIVPALAGRRIYKAYVVPVTPQVVPPPLKPQFKTPLRDGAYYGTYYSRVYRYGRLGRLLNVPPAVQTIQQPQTQPVPENNDPITPRDP
jgi:hypothetical protein